MEIKQPNFSKESVIKPDALTDFTNEFLGEKHELLEKQVLDQAILEGKERAEGVIKELGKLHPLRREVSYDSFHESFTVKYEQGISLGTLIASRHLGINLTMNDVLDRYEGGRRAVSTMKQKLVEDHVSQSINKKLAEHLARETAQKDALLSKAYSKIAERSELTSEQLGVRAEQLVIGKMEAIAIDHPEFGLSVSPANAFQDVGEKIDFVLSTQTKKRGVGVEEGDLSEEKHIGIQFTINTLKKEHKTAQINSSKKRGTEMDDILLVTIDMSLFEQAIKDWEQQKKPLCGPWNYLPENVQHQALNELLKSLLSDEQIKQLTTGK